MTLRLPKLLDDGCVLQAGVDMHIWGTGDPGRIVLTRLADERHMVQVKDDGTWNAPYGPIEAGGPYELTICYEDGAERISRQCYAGEVFLCSGQSNMEMALGAVSAAEALEAEKTENVRMLNVPHCARTGGVSRPLDAAWARKRQSVFRCGILLRPRSGAGDRSDGGDSPLLVGRYGCDGVVQPGSSGAESRFPRYGAGA